MPVSIDSNFSYSDFLQKVKFFCQELGFSDQIAIEIKQIVDNSHSNLERQDSQTNLILPNFANEPKIKDIQIPNSNQEKLNLKNIEPLNSQLQIEKIDLKTDSETDPNPVNKLENSLVILDKNFEKKKLINLAILDEQKTQIQSLIKKEYARINGQTIEQVEINLQNWQSSKTQKTISTKINTENQEKKFNLDFSKDFKNFDSQDNLPILPNDMAYVRGQIVAKRALEIAASGGHNVLFLGSPGSGKTLLARAYGGILPSMTEQEILEATQIYSVAGLLARGQIIHQRPFRAPHHSASHVALVGGGSRIRPGEASLAHRGVLFLDEFPEFGRDTIEALRQPLEDGFVSIARASGSLIFPSKFYLLAAANPTPSGFDPDDPDALNKPQNRAAISRYQARFSGPIMDRIDIHVEVSRPKSEELQSTVLAEKSYQIAKRVQIARDIQTQRFANYYKDKPNLMPIQSNSEMNLPMIQKFCVLDSNSQKLLSSAIERFKLSARAYMRLLKLSRTIADLAQSENIQTFHLAESLQYRGRWS